MPQTLIATGCLQFYIINLKTTVFYIVNTCVISMFFFTPAKDLW